MHRNDLFRKPVVIPCTSAKVQLADRHHAMSLRARLSSANRSALAQSQSTCGSGNAVASKTLASIAGRSDMPAVAAHFGCDALVRALHDRGGMTHFEQLDDRRMLLLGIRLGLEHDGSCGRFASYGTRQHLSRRKQAGAPLCNGCGSKTQRQPQSVIHPRNDLSGQHLHAARQ